MDETEQVTITLPAELTESMLLHGTEGAKRDGNEVAGTVSALTSDVMSLTGLTAEEIDMVGGIDESLSPVDGRG